MAKNQKPDYPKIALLASVVWIIAFFLLIPHLIELPNLLESFWTSKGLVYYRDFATFHFPLGRWILLPFYLATNWNLQAGPWAGLILNLACVFLLYKFGQKHLDAASTAISLIFFTAFSWFLGTGIMFYHEMFIGLLLLVAFVVFSKGIASNAYSPKNAFSLGLVLSVAEFSGQIATPTVIAVSLVYLAYILFRKSVKKNPGVLFFFALGMLIPFVLLLFYFYFNGGLRDFYEQNFLYYTTYANTYEKVPLLKLPIKELLLFYSLPILSLFLVIYLKLKNKKIGFLYLSSAIFSLSTIPFVLFSVFHFHHVSYALPLTALTGGLFLNELGNHKFSIPFRKILIFLLMLAISIKILPWYFQRLSIKNFSRIANDMTAGDTMYQTVDWVKKNTPDSSTILVAGDPLFYFSSQRLPSSKNVYVSPYNWEPLNRTISEVDRKLPDYWIINRTYFARLTKEYKKESMVAYIEKTVGDKYIQRAIFDDWEIWQKTN